MRSLTSGQSLPGKAGYRFVRYADDFVVVCKTKTQAQAALELVANVMTEPSDSRNGELFRHGVCNVHQALPKAGHVDSDASPQHEIQTEVDL